ncbi:uncharacterized protein [Halyomorpha halys]|uniref:uncharacterized protein n=1 Tax=Halyomorpha halys TaxID=286706 RepID=UPI0006D4ECE8|nr:uncharacterized protein LOC106680093 [Halyomorpha halys]
MSKLLLGLLGLLGVIYFADAMTKQEVSRLIHNAGNEVRQEYIIQVKAKIKPVLLGATTPQETDCVKNYMSTTYKDLNMYMGMELNKIRSQYLNLELPELESLTEKQEKPKMVRRVKDAVAFMSERLENIRNCTTQ